MKRPPQGKGKVRKRAGHRPVLLHGSSAYSTRIDLICKKFKDTPMLDNFEKHLTFYRLKNATLLAVGAGFDDSFLAFLLLYSFNSLEDCNKTGRWPTLFLTLSLTLWRSLPYISLL